LTAERWRVSFPAPPEGAVDAVLHRRLLDRIEVRTGRGSSTEGAIAKALGRRVQFDTRADDIRAVVASFSGKGLNITVAHSRATVDRDD